MICQQQKPGDLQALPMLFYTQFVPPLIVDTLRLFVTHSFYAPNFCRKKCELTTEPLPPCDCVC